MNQYQHQHHHRNHHKHHNRHRSHRHNHHQTYNNHQYQHKQHHNNHNGNNQPSSNIIIVNNIGSIHNNINDDDSKNNQFSSIQIDRNPLLYILFIVLYESNVKLL